MQKQLSVCSVRSVRGDKNDYRPNRDIARLLVGEPQRILGDFQNLRFGASLLAHRLGKVEQAALGGLPHIHGRNSLRNGRHAD